MEMHKKHIILRFFPLMLIGSILLTSPPLLQSIKEGKIAQRSDNSNSDEKTAQAISETFFEVIIAPGYEAKGLDILKKKKNTIRIENSWPSNCERFNCGARGHLIGAKLKRRHLKKMHCLEDDADTDM